MTAAAANRVMEQALALPKAKQKILLGRLWKNLAPARPLPPSPEEMARRVESVRNGSAITYSAEEVRDSIERRLKAVKPAAKRHHRPIQ